MVAEGPSTSRARRSIVVGGGVAGVCCAEELCRLDPDSTVTLISADSNVKGAADVTKITEHLEDFRLKLQSLYSLPNALSCSNLEVLQGTASCLDTDSKVLTLLDGARLQYDQLCICTGASPKLAASHERIIALRDQDSIQDLCARLSDARRIMVLGNGGIALELVHALRSVDIIWAVRNKHIGDAFFDVDAAAFLLQELHADGRSGVPCVQTQAAHGNDLHDSKENANEGPQRGGAARPGLYSAAALSGNCKDSANSGATSFFQRQGIPSLAVGHKGGNAGRVSGMAVGPEWTRLLQQSRGSSEAALTLEYGCQLDSVVSQPDNEESGKHSWPLYVRLTNGAVHGVDFVVSATGVEPNAQWLPPEIERHPTDGGVEVDEQLRTSVPGVFAAGDVCCAVRLEQMSAQWFQMRLWTQARTMGIYAAQCMFNATAAPEQSIMTGLQFELFTHVTHFCGKKVVFLGLYNGQRLDDEPASDIVTYVRSVEGADGMFVRVLLLRGRMQGAVLIGETEMEEMCENLILNGLDVSHYGPDLVDPDAELHEVFD